MVTIGQSIFVMPLAILNLSNRMSQIPKNLEEAAWSLGSSRIQEVCLCQFFQLANFLIIATFILTFTFAFDEFIIAYFLNNFSITLPIKIWTSLVTGFDPAINAIGTLVFLTSLTLGLTAQLLFMKMISKSINLQKINKKFNTVEVIKSFNLKINEGEFVTLLGPSGCGKTTLLRMIAGLENVSAGEIYIGNENVTNIHLIKGIQVLCFKIMHYFLI